MATKERAHPSVLSGVIVETGSNANGHWIKYENGIMFCYGFQTDNISSWVTSNNIYRRDFGDMFFPQVFDSVIEINVNVISNSVWIEPRSFDAQGFATTLYSYTNSGNTGDYDVHFRAIGTWDNS